MNRPSHYPRTTESPAQRKACLSLRLSVSKAIRKRCAEIKSRCWRYGYEVFVCFRGFGFFSNLGLGVHPFTKHGSWLSDVQREMAGYKKIYCS